MAKITILKAENIVYYYPDSEQPSLRNVDLSINEGEFLLVAGGSGSGKSSLARSLAGLIPDFYGGRFGGNVIYRKQDIRDLDRRTLAREIGIVFQDPEKQLVMTGVEAEIAFGLENLGLSQPEMFRRAAEVMGFLGLTSHRTELSANLSGGCKQKLALAAVLAMQPGVLILDEPTSQLDPAAAEEFFNLIKRLNEDMNLTIVLIEQRLERCYHLADQVALMEGGRIVHHGKPSDIALKQAKEGFSFIPPVARLFAQTVLPEVPLTVKEGRQMLKKWNANTNQSRNSCMQLHGHNAGYPPGETIVETKNLWFSYPNGGREVLRGINVSVRAGEFVAIIGENASGKTTFLKQLTGLLKPDRGKVVVGGRDTRHTPPYQLASHVGYLSQNPNDYLFQDTVEEELKFTLDNLGLYCEERIELLLDQLGLKNCRGANPRDLSGGERQRVALASVLVHKPHLVVLDEPTRGIDYTLKTVLGELFLNLTNEGKAVILVTHDIEFAAEYANRVVMVYDGQIVCDGFKHQVLTQSFFYAPQVCRLFKDIDKSVLTFQEALQKLKSIIPAHYGEAVI